MASTSEQLHALLRIQLQALARLSPSQSQLFELVAKLQSFSLGESHAESKASFDTVMKEYHEAFIKFQEAQAQLKALNLKFLRRGANADGEAESHKDATRTEEENKFGTSLVAELGIISDEKLLKICNEQRDVVDYILNCSTTLRDGLSRIIDRVAANEYPAESEDGFSSISDSGQSELSDGRHTPSEGIKAQRALQDEMKTEIQLMAANERITSLEAELIQRSPYSRSASRFLRLPIGQTILVKSKKSS